MKKRLFIVDDQCLVRQGIMRVLERLPLYEIVGEAEDGRKAVYMALELKPDLIVMSVSMPVMNGIEATRRISKEMPGAKIIALSSRADTKSAVEMLDAGARSYLVRPATTSELVQAIDITSRGGTYIDPVVSKVCMAKVFKYRRDKKSAFSVLSPREREILQMIAESMQSKEIARILRISIKTVDTHRQKIIEKLECNSIAGLTKYAIREGLTSA